MGTPESYPFYDPSIYSHEGLPLCAMQPTSTPLWPTVSSTNYRNAPQPSLRQEMLRKTYEESPSICRTTNSTTLHTDGSVRRCHFCTYCYEDNIIKYIKTKQDWKRHQEDYHSGTGIEWHCQYNNCSMVFHQGLQFKQHLKKDHHGQVFPRDCKVIIQQERVYACGFENCRELNNTWKTYCDHVSTHMQKGHTEWSYDKTIRNLLKQDTIARTWKEVYSHLSPQYNVLHTQLTWNPKTTGMMKQKLEYLQIDPSLEDFLRNVFLVGIPQLSISDPTMSTLQSPGFVSSPTPQPAITSSNFREMSTSLRSPMEHANLDPSIIQPYTHFGTTESMMSELPRSVSGYRNSLTMTEALPLSGYEDQGLFHGEEADSAYELNYCNPTPPLPPLSAEDDNTGAFDSRKSSPKTLMTKGREWLHGKRSQPFQQPSTVDPDIISSSSMPTSPLNKTASTYPADPNAGLYCYQF
jgi:hypothetical protein